MIKIWKRALGILMVTGLVFVCQSCGQFRQQADSQFGDQNFKSAVALIELHKVRFGHYPTDLTELKFTGSWDQIWMSAVQYTKLEDGYELDLVRGWVGTPELEYPPEFWQGLGIRKTNVRRKVGA
jgi:hypothetical protein